ncbi:MAG: Rossmann-fold NAD(P)-binding domain-containing protein [Thermoplasmataceae archaeon]
MRLLIIGSAGRFGVVLTKIMRESGHSVIEIPDENHGNIDKLIMSADTAFLSTPLSATIQYIEKYSHITKLIEISSVKRPLVKYGGKITSIHPLFGPLSYKIESYKNILFINDISPIGTIDSIASLFFGFNIISVTAEEHDRLMANVQVLPFILSMLSSRINTPVSVKTRSKGMLEKFAEISENENRAGLVDMIKFNLFSKELFSKIRKEIDLLEGEIFADNP